MFLLYSFCFRGSLQLMLLTVNVSEFPSIGGVFEITFKYDSCSYIWGHFLKPFWLIIKYCLSQPVSIPCPRSLSLSSTVGPQVRGSVSGILVSPRHREIEVLFRFKLADPKCCVHIPTGFIGPLFTLMHKSYQSY